MDNMKTEIGHDMKREIGKKLPRARKEGLLIQELPEEVLVFDLSTAKAHCLNHTAALVWRRCDGKTSIAEVTKLLQKEWGTHVDAGVVLLALDQLEKARLIEEGSALSDRVSRRDVLRRIGWAAAVTLPLITSVLAPTAASAATCIPDSACGPSTCGFPCHITGNSDCTKVCRPRSNNLANCTSLVQWQCVGLPAGQNPCPC